MARFFPNSACGRIAHDRGIERRTSFFLRQCFELLIEHTWHGLTTAVEVHTTVFRQNFVNYRETNFLFVMCVTAGSLRKKNDFLDVTLSHRVFRKNFVNYRETNFLFVICVTAGSLRKKTKIIFWMSPSVTGS